MNSGAKFEVANNEYQQISDIMSYELVQSFPSNVLNNDWIIIWLKLDLDIKALSPIGAKTYDWDLLKTFLFAV